MIIRNLSKNTFLVLSFVAMLLSLSCGCSKNPLITSDFTKTVIQGNGSYVAYSVEELAANAHTIVRGTVVSKGESFELIFGKSSVVLATPITVKVTEWIKGDQASDTVIFNKMGGETATKIMAEISPTLNEADDVILCLSADGYALGPDSIFRIQKDNLVAVMYYQSPELECFKDWETPSQIDLSELIEVNELISEFAKWLR